MAYRCKAHLITLSSVSRSPVVDAESGCLVRGSRCSGACGKYRGRMSPAGRLLSACCSSDERLLCAVQTQALCEMPRGGLQLLPYYMRIAAALSRVFPDIGQGAPLHPTIAPRPKALRCR